MLIANSATTYRSRVWEVGKHGDQPQPMERPGGPFKPPSLSPKAVRDDFKASNKRDDWYKSHVLYFDQTPLQSLLQICEYIGSLSKTEKQLTLSHSADNSASYSNDWRSTHKKCQTTNQSG